MRRAVTLIFAVSLLGCLVPVAASAAPQSFPLGVAAGEVTPTSAVLWTRTGRPGRVQLQLARARTFRGLITVGLEARAADNLTVQARIGRLRAGRAYFYRFTAGKRRSAVGSFRTAPPSGQARTIEFAYSGDADAQRAPGQTEPFYNRFEVYREMAEEGNDFNINFGDTIYSDTEVGATMEGGQFMPSAPTALTVPQKWAKYRQNITLPNLQRLRRSAGLYSHWDDHEFINDFSVAENGRKLYAAGVKAFRDYSPVSYSSRDGLYRSRRWGRHLELFFLDERSFRDAKASDGGTCDNPETGQPDLAPTAPQKNRDFFAILAPSLKQPVSPACLARIRDGERTFLGSRQYKRFTREVKRSKATFKVIMNETPIQQYYALPYDRWEGYEAERRRLINYLRKNVKNVVFLTTDTHANLVNEVRLRTLEQGGPINSGMFEFVTGPVATKTFSKEIDDAVGREGAGAAVSAAFFEPEPPDGVGMDCAATNTYSYAQVRVTGKQLTITPKNLNGKPVQQDSDQLCGPFTITAE